MKVSLSYKLETQGYLSLNQFVKYLKSDHPGASICYPTALKLVRDGKLRATMIGSHYRVTEAEARRWVAEGNWERKFSTPYKTYDGGM